MFACVFGLGLAAIATPQAEAQTFSVVHDFAGGSDGANPFSGLIAVGKTLYGTTQFGGTSNNGVVFKMSTSGKETVLYNFATGTDGANPQASLIRDKKGNFYGTTTSGGAFGEGTVFELTGKKETVLYSFKGTPDGIWPFAPLLMDVQGNLFGTTFAGGSNNNGTVFMLSPPKKRGAPWMETVLYSFGTGTDGANPIAGVSLDMAGNLYGTASAGGLYGYGTVYQLTRGKSWTETTLHDFQGAEDGDVPYAGLIADKAGNFYGAATGGGANAGGTVFELTRSKSGWTFTLLYSIWGWDVSGTFRDLVMDKSGNLYGTTHCDGVNNAGTVYELTPSGDSWTYTQLYTFTGGNDGLYSYSNPTLIGGKIYGTTAYGGTQTDGVVWVVTP
jgi:uncharacterized repeat protein (TIGR03803 family)